MTIFSIDKNDSAGGGSIFACTKESIVKSRKGEQQ